MKGGGEKKQTTMPDPALQRYREEVFNKARDVGNQGYTPFTGARVASTHPASGGALHHMGGLANSLGGMQFGSGVPGERQFGLNMGRNFGANLDPYEQAGATGARALGGDSSAIDRLMNPYQQNVIRSMDSEFNRMRGKASLGANDEATAAGAFGGDRHALMQGERLGAIDRTQGQTIANLLHGGFNDMMGRAGQAAGMGLNAGGLHLGADQAAAGYSLDRDQAAGNYALGAGDQRLRAQGMGLDARRAQMDALGRQFGMGDYFRNAQQQQLDANYGDFLTQRDWGQRQLGTMMGPLSGSPYGQTTSEPLQRNAFTGAAGGAMTGMALGGPWGAALGGLGGLLFG